MYYEMKSAKGSRIWIAFLVDEDGNPTAECSLYSGDNCVTTYPKGQTCATEPSNMSHWQEVGPAALIQGF